MPSKDKMTLYNASHCKDPTAYNAIKNMDALTMDALTKEEKQIITIIRKTGYGEVTVKVRGGKPVLATESRTTKLD
jgi:hypothetical protein